MDKELIKKARQANLAGYLMSVGVPLEKNGHRHRHKEHKSLVFTNNAYFLNSRQEHGNAIDYLVRHMGMDFVSAVLALAYGDVQNLEKPATPPKFFDLSQVSLNSNCYKAKAYLNKARHIGHGVIDTLIKKSLLFQENQTNNIIFPMYDENNNCVGAELCGVTAKRFKGIKENSKYGYGFNIRFSDENTYDYALFFESAVDLISFMDYKLNCEKKSLERCILISMAGMKMNIVKHTSRSFSGKLQVVLCVDNDTAGQKFKKDMEQAQISYMDRSPDEDYKDWNEQLMCFKKHSKPIQRLMNQIEISNQNIR